MEFMMMRNSHHTLLASTGRWSKAAPPGGSFYLVNSTHPKARIKSNVLFWKCGIIFCLFPLSVHPFVHVLSANNSLLLVVEEGTQGHGYCKFSCKCDCCHISWWSAICCWHRDQALQINDFPWHTNDSLSSSLTLLRWILYLSLEH